MGDPLSVAQASALCQWAECKCEIKRKEEKGDNEWNTSYCFMDDLNMRVGYDGKGMTKEMTKEYLNEMKECYPNSLNLE